MKLLNFIKNNLFIQNFFSSLFCLSHPFFENVLAKYSAIKKSMFMIYHDETRGIYLEFGVFTGNSFNFAMKINMKMEKLFDKKMDIEFVGFDSFSGFKEIKKEDENPTFKSQFFKVDEKKVLRNIKKNSNGQRYRLIKGFYKDTIKEKTPKDLDIEKSSIILIDCDLKDSTLLALNFCKSTFQEGTIIIFDDFNYFQGNELKGEYGAFEDFKKNNPGILFRRIFDYGYSGRAFIVSKIK